MFYAKERAAIYLHVPKTGGTSMFEALRTRSGLKHHRIKRLGSHPTALRTRETIGEDEWRRCFTFATCRDPYDRLVSIWADLQRRPSSIIKGLADTGYSERKRRYLARQSLSYDFATWVLEFAEEFNVNPFGGTGVPMTRLPQAHWLCDKSDRVMIDAVMQIERADKWANMISKRLGVRLRLPRLNQTIEPGWHDNFHNDATWAFVERHLAIDFAALGYSFRKRRT